MCDTTGFSQKWCHTISHKPLECQQENFIESGTIFWMHISKGSLDQIKCVLLSWHTDVWSIEEPIIQMAFGKDIKTDENSVNFISKMISPTGLQLLTSCIFSWLGVTYLWWYQQRRWLGSFSLIYFLWLSRIKIIQSLISTYIYLGT